MKKVKLNGTFAEWYDELKDINLLRKKVLTGNIVEDIREFYQFMVIIKMANGKTLLPKLIKNIGYNVKYGNSDRYLYCGIVYIKNCFAYKKDLIINFDDDIKADGFDFGCYEDGVEEYINNIKVMLIDLVNQMKQYYIDNNISTRK